MFRLVEFKIKKRNEKNDSGTINNRNDMINTKYSVA